MLKSHPDPPPPRAPPDWHAEQRVHSPVTLLQQGLQPNQVLVQLLCAALCFTARDVCIASQGLSLSAETQLQCYVCSEERSSKSPTGYFHGRDSIHYGFFSLLVSSETITTSQSWVRQTEAIIFTLVEPFYQRLERASGIVSCIA